MWKRLTRMTMSAPSIQWGNSIWLLPHWMLSVATYSGTSSSMAEMAKFEGFQRWRPRQRMTYFDMMASTLQSA